VDHLIELARQKPYVLGTRMTGGGFGGSTVHIVASEAIATFNRDVVDRYMADTGLNAPMYVCQAVAGVSSQDL
jgi:galactokinase